MSVNTFTLPIVLWFYFKQPVYSIFLNLAVIPLMSVLMAGLDIALIACILSAFWGGFLLQCHIIF